MARRSPAVSPRWLPDLHGVIGACLTPFTAKGEIDYVALQSEIEFLVPDCQAITVGAVEASEYSVLTIQQRKELMREVTAIVDGRVPVILGASAPAIPTVLELAEWAADVGGDFAQVLMPSRPWGGEPSSRDLHAYFDIVTSGSPLPIVAYHNPSRGSDPPLETWISLSQQPGIRAFKDSSRNIRRIARLIEEIDLAGHAHYLTTMEPLLITLILGGSGAMMPPPGTRIGARVVEHYRAGRIDEARVWQRLFGTFPGRWIQPGLAPLMKSALLHFGIDIGEPSAPYEGLSAEAREEVGRFLRDTGALDGDVDATRVGEAVAVLRDGP